MSELDRMYAIKSFTTQDEYIIRKFKDGSYKCSCPNFLFNERKILMCKHVLSVIDFERGNENDNIRQITP